VSSQRSLSELVQPPGVRVRLDLAIPDFGVEPPLAELSQLVRGQSLNLFLERLDPSHAALLLDTAPNPARNRDENLLPNTRSRRTRQSGLSFAEVMTKRFGHPVGRTAG
jgi:hypothetical protein